MQSCVECIQCLMELQNCYIITVLLQVERQKYNVYLSKWKPIVLEYLTEYCEAGQQL